MIRFHPIQQKDIETAVAMMSDFYAIDGYPIDIDRSKKLLSDFIATPSLGRSWLISEKEQIAGYLILTFIFSFEYGGNIAFLDELYIKESFRGRKIGKDSIAFVKEEASRLNLRVLYLEVEPHNSNAQKLYQNAGFETHKRALMRYQPD